MHLHRIHPNEKLIYTFKYALDRINRVYCKIYHNQIGNLYEEIFLSSSNIIALHKDPYLFPFSLFEPKFSPTLKMSCNKSLGRKPKQQEGKASQPSCRRLGWGIQKWDIINSFPSTLKRRDAVSAPFLVPSSILCNAKGGLHKCNYPAPQYVLSFVMARIAWKIDK